MDTIRFTSQSMLPAVAGYEHDKEYGTYRIVVLYHVRAEYVDKVASFIAEDRIPELEQFLQQVETSYSHSEFGMTGFRFEFNSYKEDFDSLPIINGTFELYWAGIWKQVPIRVYERNYYGLSAKVVQVVPRNAYQFELLIYVPETNTVDIDLHALESNVDQTIYKSQERRG